MCAGCGASPQARLIHDDECHALVALFASNERPSETRSLRLILRVLFARWRALRCSAEEQYVSAEGDWWGDGDVVADDYDDIICLVEPPEGATWQLDELDDAGGEAPPRLMERALVEMGKQARFFAGAHARVGLWEAAALMGKLACNTLTLYAWNDQPAADRVPKVVGCGLSASVAMFNHDCDPNADWSMDSSGCLVVRTIRPVQANEEICITCAPADRAQLVPTCSCPHARVHMLASTCSATPSRLAWAVLR